MYPNPIEIHKPEQILMVGKKKTLNFYIITGYSFEKEPIKLL
jgi:hypothetical protein